MKCEFCNSDTITRSVRKQHWFKGRLYIVENVNAEVCPECGEPGAMAALFAAM